MALWDNFNSVTKDCWPQILKTDNHPVQWALLKHATDTQWACVLEYALRWVAQAFNFFKKKITSSMHNKAKCCKTKYSCLCQSRNAKQQISIPEDEHIRLNRTQNFLLSGVSKDVKEQNSMVSYCVTQHHLSDAATECHDVRLWWLPWHRALT